jgi:transposase-like protein
VIVWEYVHIAIDDATRLADVEVLADEKALTAIGFLRRAVQHFAAYGITVQQLLTDNGSAYRSAIHAIACRGARNPPPPHPALPTPHQRQGGAVHTHHAPWLGLRSDLPLEHRTQRSTHLLA